ncbi:hypothetical protein PHYBOEH_007845 [Phytophthora boehmeriae]|uniref:Uncharacterized protein n=1 Tax=Phytophthora boehmeriae TaxID=109152 RepID=A0A8T1W512_9STRA|nr:hypothetical protein PHYBOEH_007845 [Phytophthora boehmeriae]
MQINKSFRCKLPILAIYFAGIMSSNDVKEDDYSSDEKEDFLEDESDLSSSNKSESDTDSVGVWMERDTDEESDTDLLMMQHVSSRSDDLGSENGYSKAVCSSSDVSSVSGNDMQ